ncbi:DUF4179 domain-containing protein [Metasolibacillus sp.]|uniref:DUF4179 domain-containing protein n=1 Tax=Metasolibacillus sp. TaxID=2703680 RepID=UPI0025EE927A|nr:DUF4179 domain-containing protein [Metasolibacillus sp.]MCT6924970.1 DUF4179 domain-containing protein [Metasolibacillus sp.]MCT6942364.1 DUF4179 domain-containing protein [Metasolibacillus sp.]
MNKELLEKLEQIKVPKAALQQARLSALKRRRKNRRTLQLILVAALFFFALTASIRFSPQIATAAAKIPLLAPFVHMITYDKGLEDILAHEYAEDIVVEAESNGKKLMITSVVADESGLLIAYRFDNGEVMKHPIDFAEVKLLQNGEALPAGVTMYFDGAEDKSIMESTLDVIFVENTVLNGNDFELFVQLNDQLETTFTLPFTLSKPVAQSKHYPLNEQLFIDGQEIYSNGIEISPLRVEVSFTIPETNTKRILDFDLHLVDEVGEEWETTRNGTTGYGGISSGTFTRFMQSNYFREPKSLTLIVENVTALEKGKDYIEVDFSQKQVLYMPEELQVELNIASEISIDTIHPLEKAGHGKPLFSTLIDANGEEWYSTQSSSLIDDSKKSESSYLFNKGFANPVKMYIQHYPLYLNGSAELEIPIR